MRDLGQFGDEFVVVRQEHESDLTEITINCPDKVGLGCDLTRIVFEFNLSVIKGDLATDGRWCFVVLWVEPRTRLLEVRWSLLKQRLEDVCPSAVASMLPPPAPPVHQSKRVLMLTICSSDRVGLLNDVAQMLWEMEFTIHKVKVSTSPTENSVNFFFITDNRNKLPWKKKGEELTQQVKELLGETCSHCEIGLADPELKAWECLPLPGSLTKDFFYDGPSPFEKAELNQVGVYTNNTKVTIDTSISPLHTLLQITCKKRKGLLYDCLRTVKDKELQVAHMRIATLEDGNSETSVFILKPDGKKITDIQEQKDLCKRVHEQIDQPLRLKVVTRGPDTELLIATPIEKCGRGRPRVVYDVTLALKLLDICIFQADIGRYDVNERRWEVYRFLLSDKEDLPLKNSRIRNLIVDRVRTMLMG